MGGCSIVFLWLIALPVIMVVLIFGLTVGIAAAVYLVYAYILESLFCACLCRHLWQKRPFQGWIPLWGQYLLGRAADAPGLGIAVATDHLLVLGLCCFGSILMTEQMAVPVLVSATVGMVLKAVLTHRLYRIAVPDHYKVMSVASVLSLGVLRPIFLFVIRKKVIMFSKNT